MKNHLLFLLLLCPVLSFGQYVFTKRTNIPVSEGSRTLKFPWAGGLNNPQFSAADLDNNDTLDLVIFDRTGNKVITFLNNGTPGMVDYTYNPEYEAAFSRYHQWMLMKDFDCDGIEDVLTYNIGAIDFYKGAYDTASRIAFDSVTTLSYVSQSGVLPIFITSIDIPAVEDINDDGDVDILTFEQLGGVLLYFENQSQELTEDCNDTIIFNRASTCWGDFYEPTSTNVVVLNSCGGFEPDTCVGALKTGGQTGNAGGQRHPGSTVLAFDEDGDGDKEVILGDISFDRINRLVNGGNLTCADIVAQDSAFPSYDLSYRTPIFPASFYVDVNNDALRDLLVAPNATRTSENYNCSWYYKNVGTEDSVVFDFQTDTFLIHDMLDFGEGAHPAFFDYNGDSLLDLVIGNYGYYVNGVTYRSGLALLKNTGTAQLPEYQLVDTDYEDISALGRKAIAPAFGDLDGDGDKDMIVGEFDGFLHYYENTAGAGNQATFAISLVQMFGIDVGQFSSPFIFDLNGDSLLDLIVGEKNGNVNYFENRGSASAMVFDTLPTNSYLGEIDIRIQGFPNGYSTPLISPLDSSGRLYLVVGCEEGVLRVYDFDPDAIYGGEFRRRLNQYSNIDEGERSSPAIADVTGDMKYEMVVGNYRGGVSFFSQSDSIAYPDPVSSRYPVLSEIGLEVYPNPATAQVNIVTHGFKAAQPIVITLTDILGRNLAELKTTDEKNLLALPQVNTGMYFLRAQQGSTIITKKLLITAP